jgi:N-acetylmuramic acid 6-phosphate etherase
MKNLDRLTTEARNPASEKIDSLSALEIVRVINSEDAKIAAAVRNEEAAIAQAIEIITGRLQAGGRLVYIGAGTSGRLGVLDASECPPTFNTDPAMVVGLIAGGDGALRRSIEGAEDFPEYAEVDLKKIDLSAGDVLVGIATSGRTPYVVGGLAYAQKIGAAAIGFTCNATADLDDVSDLVIRPVVGPEIVSGSTRMKAGTATKLVLNMLTTGTMIRLGKTYGNLMVDLRATNQKLTERTRRIVKMLTGLDDTEALALLDRCGGELKTSVIAHSRGVSAEEARRLLDAAKGQLRGALGG